MEGYKDVALHSVKYVQIDGQVFKPIGIEHMRNNFEYQVKKMIGEKIPLIAMENVAKIPLPQLKNMKKGVTQLRKIQNKLDDMYDIFDFFIKGDWIYVNNRIYPLISRMSDEEKEEFNCDVLKIYWSDYL